MFNSKLCSLWTWVVMAILIVGVCIDCSFVIRAEAILNQRWFNARTWNSRWFSVDSTSSTQWEGYLLITGCKAYSWLYLSCLSINEIINAYQRSGHEVKRWFIDKLAQCGHGLSQDLYRLFDCYLSRSNAEQTLNQRYYVESASG